MVGKFTFIERDRVNTSLYSRWESAREKGMSVNIRYEDGEKVKEEMRRVINDFGRKVEWRGMVLLLPDNTYYREWVMRRGIKIVTCEGNVVEKLKEVREFPLSNYVFALDVSDAEEITQSTQGILICGFWKKKRIVKNTKMSFINKVTGTFHKSLQNYTGLYF